MAIHALANDQRLLQDGMRSTRWRFGRGFYVNPAAAQTSPWLGHPIENSWADVQVNVCREGQQVSRLFLATTRALAARRQLDPALQAVG